MTDTPRNNRPGPLEEDMARKIYEILVVEGGARDSAHEEDSFVYHATRNYDLEWRFSGKLGFGGKFKNNCWGWYVDGYTEDYTPERLAIVESINKKLKELNATSV